MADQEQRIDEGRRSVQELTDQIEKNRNSIEEIWKKFDLQTKELKERLDSMENEFARLRSPGDRSDTRSGDKSREERFPPVVRPGETPPSGSPKVDVGTEKEPGTQSVGIPSVTPGGTGSSVPPAGSPQPGPQVSKTQKPKPELDFDEALKVFRKDRSFPRARFLLNQFISNYPNHDLADDAQYLIGESYFEEKNFERAILAFNKVQVDYANGDKAPDALLKEALAFLNLGDKASAGELLGRVVQKYPESEAAKVATERLNSL